MNPPQSSPSQAQPQANPKVKATICFDPSPDLEALTDENQGGAGYHVMIFSRENDQAPLTKKGEINLDRNTHQFDIEGFVEETFALGVSARAASGVMSFMTHVSFKMPPSTPPARPQNVRIAGIRPTLAVIHEPRKRPAAKQPCEDCGQHDDKFTITVRGNPLLKDGAVGVVTGVDPVNHSVVKAQFPPNAFKNGAKPDGEVWFDAKMLDPGEKILILSPHQETMTIAEYINLINSMLNKNADDATPALVTNGRP